MSTTEYQDWHPGSIMTDSARRYTELVNQRRRPARPRLEGQPAELYTAASQLICTADNRFRHLLDATNLTCVRCNQTAQTILERTAA